MQNHFFLNRYEYNYQKLNSACWILEELSTLDDLDSDKR